MSPLDYVLEDARICLLHTSDNPIDAMYRSMCGGLGTYSLAIPYPGLCIITAIADNQDPTSRVHEETEATESDDQEDTTTNLTATIRETPLGYATPTAVEPAADTREIPTIKNRLRELVTQRADAKYGAAARHAQEDGASGDLTEKRTATKGYR